jgi:hypothetical protein
MEKATRFVSMGLLLVSTIWMGCSSVLPTTITKNNVSVLKGKWEGLMTFGSAANIRVPTTME